MYYKRNGEPYEGTDREQLAAWGRDFANHELKIVKQENLWTGLFVSTVWLGLDHGFNDDKPIIFETMVFPGNSLSEIECMRYSTEEEALKGHRALVKEYSGLRGAMISLLARIRR